MSALKTLIRRDLVLAARAGGATLTLILFYALIVIFIPVAVGPDRELLARIGPAIIWIAALLSMLMTMERLFRDDAEDGTLTGLRLAPVSLEAVVAGKLLAHWLTTALPLMIVTPLAALLLGLSPAVTMRTLVALLIGTPALSAWGAIGAAITLSLRRGGLIAPILVLPLSVPVLIFGVGAADPLFAGSGRAALLFLGAVSLLAAVIAPFAAALALKTGAE
jgi:heme exporter protein B